MTRNPSKKEGRRGKRRNAQTCPHQQWSFTSTASWRVRVENNGKGRKCDKSLGRKNTHYEAKIQFRTTQKRR